MRTPALVMEAAEATAGAAPTVAGDEVTAPMVVGDEPLAAVGPGTGTADRVESNPTPFVLRLTVTLMAPIVVNPTDRPSPNFMDFVLFCGDQVCFVRCSGPAG